LEPASNVLREGTSASVASEETALENNARAIFGPGRSQLHEDLEAIQPSFAEDEEELRSLEWQVLDEWAQGILNQMNEDGPSPAAVGTPLSLEVEPEQVPVVQQAQPLPAQMLPMPPPPIVIYRESRSTSPPAQPEYASVGVGQDEVLPLLTLPSGISLDRVIKAVREHHGSDLGKITETLIDRPRPTSQIFNAKPCIRCSTWFQLPTVSAEET